MNTIRWAIVALISVVTGILAVRYLTETPLHMATVALLLFLATAALLVVIFVYFRRAQILLAVLLALAGFVSGWLVMNSIFLNQEEERHLPAANPPPAEQRDHTAVIYLTHGEPPGYSAMPWVETFKEFDALQAEFIPVPFRPFFFKAFREEYLKVGGSPHNILHHSMMDSLERMYRASGDEKTRFYIAFLDSNPRPDEAVLDAINEGANRVVIANVFMTISSHTEAGQELVDELDVENKHGIPICYSDPLWNSDLLRQLYVTRANKLLNGTDRKDVGILLVGHGQPASWDEKWPTQTSQEQAYREQLMQALVAEGYDPEHISLAWMEFKEPLIEQVAPQLIQSGVKKLFVMATSISASSLHSLYDIPHAVEASLPEGSQVEVINLGAWDNDPLVIQAIYEKAQACK